MRPVESASGAASCSNIGSETSDKLASIGTLVLQGCANHMLTLCNSILVHTYPLVHRINDDRTRHILSEMSVTRRLTQVPCLQVLTGRVSKPKIRREQYEFIKEKVGNGADGRQREEHCARDTDRSTRGILHREEV